MTLLIGFYDFPWGKHAYEYDGEKLTPVELSNNQFYKIRDTHNSKIFDKYDTVFLCEDSEFIKLK